jgi:GDPmannose 4,6-dehydratase
LVPGTVQSVDLEIEFQGSGLEEKGIDKKTGRELVSVNAEYFRPAEKISLIGNPGKAEKLLGWKASKAVSDIIQEMVEADVDRLKGSS